MMKRFIPSLFLLAFLVCAAAAQSTLFIVRHAEKVESADKDPDLSEAGRARAESLSKVLKDADIKAIYATGFKRTQQTAAPLARALGIEIAVAPAKAADFALKLRATDGNALVVGHSNTVPDLIRELGVSTSIILQDKDYDDLFVVVLEPKPRLIRLHYL